MSFRMAIQEAVTSVGVSGGILVRSFSLVHAANRRYFVGSTPTRKWDGAVAARWIWIVAIWKSSGFAV